MFWRRRSHVLLHLLLALLLVTPGVVAPMQGVAGELARLTAAAITVADAPCDMHAAGNRAQMPCDCCTPHDCDLTACLGVSCLPELPALIAAIPPSAQPTPWNAPPLPTSRADAPLRPPKA